MALLDACSLEVAAVDRFEGRCWLDWRANASTLLGSVEVTVDPSDDHRRFTLTEYAGPVRRSVEHHVDLS